MIKSKITDKVSTIVILYDHMLTGGIENYIINLILACKKKGYRIIWISPVDRKIAPEFKDILLDDYITIINCYKRHMQWFKYDDIVFNTNEIVRILSFTVFDFYRSEQIRKKYSKKCEMHSFYLIPHFTGNPYFIERYFNGKMKSIIKKIMQSKINGMIKNNNIVFFSKRHIKSLSENYNIKINNADEKLLAPYINIEPFDYNNADERSERNNFNIITIGRFEFPHKGYIIGLVKTFAKLKQKYPFLTLNIIGYGDNEQQLLDVIKETSPKIQEDIKLIGQVSPLRLSEYFRKSHLNISVAGAVKDGAHCGVISLPARHYTYECEVYGYLPESKDSILSDIPGIPVDVFIEEVINMSKQNFIDMCKKSYDTFDTRETNNPLYILDRKNIEIQKQISIVDIIFIRIIYRLLQIKNKFRSLLGKNLDPGY